MRRFACGVLTALLFCSAVSASEIPAVSAKSVVLMDADSGRVLYGCNEHDPRLIASITKLMTALVALESGHALDEVVSIREEWTGIEGSSLYLKPGEQLQLETLLYGLLLRSGNDAAHAVAGFCGGDLPSFVRKMNERAVKLGMKNTRFANPSGLNGEGHYSSAYDMALLARACLEHEELRTIVSTRSITLENRVMTNHNKLLWQYDGCIGLKTGYTEKAGRTLVSAAQRDGMTLICVTLNDPNDWRDHTALFDYGFSTYEKRTLIRAGELLCTIPVRGSLVPLCQIRAREDLAAVLRPEENPTRHTICSSAGVTAPVQKDEEMGTITFSVGDEVVGRAVLRLPHDIHADRAPVRAGLARFFGR